MINRFEHKETKVCPDCGSIEIMSGEASLNFSNQLTITHICLDCGEAWEETVKEK